MTDQYGNIIPDTTPPAPPVIGTPVAGSPVGTWVAGRDPMTPITLSDLTPTPPLRVNPSAQDNNNYQGIINNSQATIKSIQDSISALNASVTPPANTSDIYNRLSEQFGIQPKTEATNSAQQAQLDAQKELDLINAQVQGLTAQYNTVPTSVQQEITGQGITKAGTARRTAEQQRTLALQAIPLQTQALVAQAKVSAAQGNAQLAQNALNAANNQLNTLFQIKSQDATNQYNYQKDQRAMIYDQLNKQEQQQIDTMQKADDRKYQTYNNNINLAQKVAKDAIDNYQSNIAGQITQLNPNDPQFMQKLGVLQGQIVAKPAVTPDITEYNFAKSQGYTGSFSDYQRQQANLKNLKPSTTLTPAPENINGTLYSVGLPNTIVSTKGQLTNTQLTKLQKVGIPPTDAQEIMNEILNGKSLEDIRQWMKSLNVEPKVLDDFMMALQGVKAETAQPSQKKLGTGLDFNNL